MIVLQTSEVAASLTLFCKILKFCEVKSFEEYSTFGEVVFFVM
jgi:hypothetical protein